MALLIFLRIVQYIQVAGHINLDVGNIDIDSKLTCNKQLLIMLVLTWALMSTAYITKENELCVILAICSTVSIIGHNVLSATESSRPPNESAHV